MSSPRSSVLGVVRSKCRSLVRFTDQKDSAPSSLLKKYFWPQLRSHRPRETTS